MKVKLALIIAFLLISSYLGAQKSIRITNGEWPPYFSENMKNGGIVSYIVTRAFELEGIDVEYGWFPWKRSLNYAKTGEWDASIGWAKKLDLEDSLIFSDPILEGKIVFFHLKNNDFNWNSLQDLKDKKIGAIIGFSYSEEFLDAEKSQIIVVVRTNSEFQNFKMLLLGRIDIFICNLEVGLNSLKNNFSSEEIELITYNNKPFYINKLRVAFSKKDPENIKTVKTFNRGLKRLIDSGEYLEIYNSYIE